MNSDLRFSQRSSEHYSCPGPEAFLLCSWNLLLHYRASRHRRQYLLTQDSDISTVSIHSEFHVQESSSLFSGLNSVKVIAFLDMLTGNNI
jgi:hypothetical protein